MNGIDALRESLKKDIGRFDIESSKHKRIDADFEGGFAIAPDEVGANVTGATSTGIAGLSIEDSSGDAAAPLFDFSLAVERIRAARRAIDESGTSVLLTARSEGFIAGRGEIAAHGTFTSLARAVPFADINGRFSADRTSA